MNGIMSARRFLAAVTGAVILLLGCAVPALADAAKAGGDMLTVGVPSDRCPIFYRDGETGAMVGIGVDLMRAAAENAGYGVVFREIGEGTLKDALDSDAYDLVMPFGSAIASAQGRASIVSDNLIQTPFTLVTEGDHALPNLNDLRVGMLSSLGGVSETVRQLHPGIEVVAYDTMSECVRALRRDSVDALLHNSYVWSYELQKPAYQDLMVQPSAMFSMDFRVGTLDTPKGRDIIDRLNGGIAALTDTRRQAIILDYTSRRLYRFDFSDYLYQYGTIALLIVLLFAAFAVIAVQRVRQVRQEDAAEMRQLVDRDALTGVYSLNGFRERVAELIRAHPDIPYLIVYTNIRNFKYVNDSLGRAAGDELLRFWADSTQKTLSDAEAIGRVTGDRFAVLRRVGGEEMLRRDDREVIDAVRNFFIEKGRETRIQVCGGVYVLTPEDYRRIDVDRMLDYARVAEKRIRESRKDGYAFYNPEQWDRGKRVADVVSRLPMAIESGQIQIWYQPQVDFDTGEITGAEALCRWNHPTLGWLCPAEFIPILEEAGLIFDLDCYVWERVCRDLRRWNEQGKRRAVSVNVSRGDIRSDRNIPGHFRDLIRAYDLKADQLRIEITETAYVEDPSLLIRTTVQLRELGFQVEMDDFGSGYSSLHMLKEVPVDRIKLDMHFLTEEGDPERCRVIVTHTIQMVRALGMDLIAEGVENVEQARFLQSKGCLEMQGFFFHKPMPVEQFEQTIDAAPSESRKNVK